MWCRVGDTVVEEGGLPGWCCSALDPAAEENVRLRPRRVFFFFFKLVVVKDDDDAYKE